MRLFTLALPLSVALVLTVPATAARPTTEFTGTPVLVSTPSVDNPNYRDVSMTVTFVHQGTVEIRVTPTIKGVVGDRLAATFRGARGDSSTWATSGTPGCVPGGILPGDEVSFFVQLIQLRGFHEGAVLDEITVGPYRA